MVSWSIMVNDWHEVIGFTMNLEYLWTPKANSLGNLVFIRGPSAFIYSQVLGDPYRLVAPRTKISYSFCVFCFIFLCIFLTEALLAAWLVVASSIIWEIATHDPWMLLVYPYMLADEAWTRPDRHYSRRNADRTWEALAGIERWIYECGNGRWNFMQMEFP